MDEKITLIQAYKAMLHFLDSLYYREGKPDNLGGFLGGLQLLEDDITVDPAAWQDWLDVVERVLKEEKE